MDFSQQQGSGQGTQGGGTPVSKNSDQNTIHTAENLLIQSEKKDTTDFSGIRPVSATPENIAAIKEGYKLAQEYARKKEDIHRNEKKEAQAQIKKRLPFIG